MAEVTISTGGEQTGSGSGSVTSVDVSGGTTGLTTSGGPITSSGTITVSGTLAIANGGTGQTTANAAFNALSPNTTRGDISVRNATVNARLALGAAGTILRSDGTDLAYSTATYPNTTTANQILYSSATNTLGGSANLTYDGTTFATPVASHSTSLTSPLIIGGSGTTQSLTYKTTTGVGTTGADHIFKSGNNGATEIARMTNAGEFLVGKTAPTTGEIVAFKKDQATTVCLLENQSASGVVAYKVQGDQQSLSYGIRNSATSPYGMIGANEVYMYGTTNFSFAANGASAVIKWSTGSGTPLEKMRLDASGQLGIGTTTPQSKLDVEGNVTIGATYSGTTAAPTNGAIIEGNVGIGKNSASTALDVVGTGTFSTSVVSPVGTFATSATTAQIIASNKTIDTTEGDSATINAMAGRFRKDATGETFTLTNSFITANSIVLLTWATTGITGGTKTVVVAGSGSATITFEDPTTGFATAPSANTDINFIIIN